LELAMAAIGLVVLMIAVFGVFVAHGGDLTPVIKAAPWEFCPDFWRCCCCQHDQ